MKITAIDLENEIKSLEKDALDGKNGTHMLFLVAKDHIACIEGYIGYESSSVTHSIALDAIVLFKKDSKSLAEHRNDIHMNGKYESSEEAINHLKETLKDKEVKLVHNKFDLENEQEDEEEF